MCKKLKIGCLIIMCWAFLPLCSLSAALLDGYSTQPVEQKTTITMSLTQYNQLKEIIERQDNRLEMLQSQLNMLKNNSVSASNELTESQNELNKLKEELMTTQESLENARLSLTQAEEMLKKQEESLNLLTKQIKAMEHKQTVLRRQRDVWAAIAALSVGAVIVRR